MTAAGRLRGDDRQRADQHRAVRQICWAWPHAQLDAEARGFTTAGVGGGSGGATHADPTSQAALAALDTPRGSLSDALIQARAEIWLKTWADLIRAVCAYSRRPLPQWRPDAVQRTIAGVVDNGGLRPSDRAAVYRLADQALAWWPPPPKPSRDKAGWMRRVDDDGLCGHCGLPAPSGRDLETGQRLARTINGIRYHNTARQGTACFWVVWRDQQKARAAG